jgi:glycosyltransferase involved in cell wall biosynthesis
VKLFSWIFNNRKTIKEYDIFHCHLTYGAVAGTLVYFFLKKILRYKKPFVVETNHAVGMPVPKFRRWLHSRMLLMRDGVAMMATDPYWQKFMSAHAYPRFEIIPNGISVEAADHTTDLKQSFFKESGIPPGCKFIVGTVGVLRPDRQPWLYVPIFKAIYERFGDDVHFILAGSGSEHDRIVELIKECGLTGKVFLPGLVTDPAAYISHMDVYVSVGVGGTAGISMIEAAMCKVPVIGIQLVESYVTREDDWFWSHVDTCEVAKKIICLLQDENKRNAIAVQQCQLVNKKFNSSAMFKSYKSFYEQIMGEG